MRGGLFLLLVDESREDFFFVIETLAHALHFFLRFFVLVTLDPLFCFVLVFLPLCNLQLFL